MIHGITSTKKIEAEIKTESTQTVNVRAVHEYLSISYEQQMQLIQDLRNDTKPAEIEGATAE